MINRPHSTELRITEAAMSICRKRRWSPWLTRELPATHPCLRLPTPQRRGPDLDWLPGVAALGPTDALDDARKEPRRARWAALDS